MHQTETPAATGSDRGAGIPIKLCAAFSSAPDPQASMATVEAMLSAFQPPLPGMALVAGVPGGAVAGPATGMAGSADLGYRLALAGGYFNASELLRRFPDERAPHVTGQAGVAAALIARHGPEVVGALNGVFSLIFCDTASGQVIIANDRYGFCPLFYYDGGDHLLLASEVKAIAAVTALDFDPASHGQFFYIGHLLGGHTLFRQVKALGPGEYLRWQPQGLHRQRYWDLASTPVQGTADVPVQEVGRQFDRAVARRIPVEADSTLLLSGGFDSRLILGSLLAQGHRPRLTVLEHAGFRRGLDGDLARQVAEHAGLACDLRPTRPHFYETPDALDVFQIQDGMVPSFGLFISQVYPEISAAMGPVWDGLALDIALGGHAQVGEGLRSNLGQLLSSQPANRRFLDKIFRRDWFQEIEDRFAESLEAELARLPDTEDGWVRFTLMHRKRRRVGTPPHYLYSRQVQALTPGIDTEFLDFALAVPQRQRRHHRLYIQLFRQAYPELTQVPVLSGEQGFRFTGENGRPNAAMAEGNGRLRRWLKATGLAPYARSARARLRGVSTDKADTLPPALVARLLRTTGFDSDRYDRAYVEKALDRLEGGSLYWMTPLTLVFYVELWRHIFDPARVAGLKAEVFRQVGA